MVDGSVVDQRSSSGGDVTTIDPATGAVSREEGRPGTVRFAGLPDHDKRVEVRLPWNEETRLVALGSDAPVEPVGADGLRTWVHHGSSISHGSDAARPTGTWPAQAALRSEVDLRDLGLGGSAPLDPFVSWVVRDTPADLIGLKLGINLADLDLMRLRAFGPAVHGFLEEEVLAAGTIRFRATGDPAEVAAGKLTLRVTRDALRASSRSGRRPTTASSTWTGWSSPARPTRSRTRCPTRCTPTPETHAIVGERFADRVFGPGGPFAGWTGSRGAGGRQLKSSTSRPRTPPASSRRCASAAAAAGSTSATRSVTSPDSACSRSRSSASVAWA